jgi:hypothetical protein
LKWTYFEEEWAGQDEELLPVWKKKVEQYYNSFYKELEPEVDASSPNSTIVDNSYLARKQARSEKRVAMLEYQRYISSSPIDICRNPLEYWCEASTRKAWPALSRWGRDLLSAPASGADIERLFSHCGQTQTDRRNRLSVDTLEALELVRCWLKLESWQQVMDKGEYEVIEKGI